MKRVKAVLIAAVLIIVQAYAFSAYASRGYMRLSYLEGDAQIMTPEAGQWGLLSINTPLGEGDQIWVPQDGIAELQLNSGSYIRLDGNTSLQILSMDEDSSQFYLSQGSAYVYYDAPQGSVIQVDDPDASTRAFDRATFRIDVQDQNSDVSCYKGYVETENQLGNTRVNAGQTVSLGRDTYGDIAPLGPPDEWDLWNRARHDVLFPTSVPVEGNYLPTELRPYSYELQRNGRWVQVPDYGYVWSPTVYVGSDWAPYRHGRWVWRGNDYVWLSYEPWGWAPYHYGRWAFAPTLGWFWVPPRHGHVYWGPGYVGWARTDDYVAWVPLAPGELYYGRGYYGRDSVNITHVDVRRVNVTRVYKNVYVNNGPTVLRHKNFHRGYRDHDRDDHVDMKIIKEKIFVKKHIRPGMPDIKPSRESYFLSDRRIPKDKTPPPRLRELRVKELKQARKFIKERDKSVMHPGKKPKALQLTTVSTPRTPGKKRNMRQEHAQEQQQWQSAPDNGRGRHDERQQMQVDERHRFAVPERDRERKEERQQVQKEQRQPADDNRGGKLGTLPAQIEQPRQPSAPDTSRSRKEEKKQVQVEKRQQPATPQKDRDRKEERQQVQKVQRQPADNNRGRKVEPVPAQVPPQRQQPVPDRGQTRKEERQQVQKVQRQPEDNNRGRKVETAPAQVQRQRQQPIPDRGQERHEERKQVQVQEQRQQAPPDSDRGGKGKRKQGQDESDQPQCGPGQRDEFNPAKCPQRRR